MIHLDWRESGEAVVGNPSLGNHARLGVSDLAARRRLRAMSGRLGPGWANTPGAVRRNGPDAGAAEERVAWRGHSVIVPTR
jgi:hypothetical protein